MWSEILPFTYNRTLFRPTKRTGKNTHLIDPILLPYRYRYPKEPSPLPQPNSKCTVCNPSLSPLANAALNTPSPQCLSDFEEMSNDAFPTCWNLQTTARVACAVVCPSPSTQRMRSTSYILQQLRYPFWPSRKRMSAFLGELRRWCFDYHIYISTWMFTLSRQNDLPVRCIIPLMMFASRWAGC